MSSQPFRILSRSFLPSVAVLALTLAPLPALTQSGGSKDTKQLRSKFDKTLQSIEKTQQQIQQAMSLYNELVEQKAGAPEATYKKLTKAVDGAQGGAKQTSSAYQGLHKDLEKFLAAWSADIESYSSEELKAAAQKSHDGVRTKFERFDASLKEAAELYHPFIKNLSEQVSFMGRDLSPEAMEALGSSAEKLNAEAESLYAKIDEVVSGTRSDLPEAEAEAEAAPDDEAPEDD